MERKIKKAAVLGAGVMGATIAAHLANVGIPSIMLDIVPNQLTPEEEKKGLTLKHPAVRSRFAVNGKQNLFKMRPAALAVPEFASLIEVGNFEDHLSRLAEVDWIIEVVVENLKIKQDLLKKVAAVRRPGAILSTNTSGIPIQDICVGMDIEIKQHFLGTHFFNPPRYMKLLEIIPLPETLPEVVKFMADFGERVLGKGVVYAKDTPNFIANRIGIFGMLYLMKKMAEDGLSIEEVDAITGPAMGRPKSASFGTTDLVGLDTFAHVAKNLYDNAPHDERREVFKVPDFIEKMIASKWLGAKTGQGFFKRIKTEARKEEAGLRLQDHGISSGPEGQISFPGCVQSRPGRREQAQGLSLCRRSGGSFAWNITSESLLYAAQRIPEIADDLYNLDNAMKWGFNWEGGPFEGSGCDRSRGVGRPDEKRGQGDPAAGRETLEEKVSDVLSEERRKTLLLRLENRALQESPRKPPDHPPSFLKERQKIVKSNAVPA